MHTVRAGLVACLALLLCSPAYADPRPSPHDISEARQAVRHRKKELGAASAALATAEARLHDLAADAERLVEAYNGELVRLRQAREALTLARARLTAADIELERARAAVAVLAAQSYGGFDLRSPAIIMISDAGDADGYLHRASTLEQLGGERAYILSRMRDAQEVSSILRIQAANAYTEHEAVAERAEQAQAAAAQAVARQRADTKELQAERDQLRRRVEAARGRAERLARRRQEALQQVGYSDALRGTGSLMGDVAANWALTQLGKPYVWAADGPSSYDCSGLTMRAWEQVGVRIDHWTGTQWTSGPHIPLDQLRRGDLLFFGYVPGDPDTIHHVGMYVGNDLMIHAPQTGDVVRIASMWRPDLVGATRPSGDQ
ncbi:C40 family peptidase [Nonomuraea sp. NPDC048916]|uniref:C40 family peptidase n=1 Tax=Nonomuraea sp. NPDC048916 TaxID=3154232 RepID=UPI0033C3A93E